MLVYSIVGVVGTILGQSRIDVHSRHEGGIEVL